ncbi:MAG: nitrate reductase [endosymbiont of Galathealinum brachiosum]|uniref:Nitrate reductase n=1 Tax=endosymbiont of Galathealinum brachiosum TaxID=2200906 RepID=A0A370D835_9GAMM|nr:MAG: nitrate reductase [endosymbiont of Galathealinum brachiosum]
MSTFIALLLSAATVFMILGLMRKARQYRATPAPLKIPVTPAPKTTGGVVLRLAKEVVLFASLFRSNKWTWLFGWLFHVSLLLAFVRHLRYIIDPDGMFGFMMPVIGLWIVQIAGQYAAFGMLIGLGGLLARRFLVARVRYISAPSDYLMLILIMMIAFSGFLMSFVSGFTVDIVAVKVFMLGIMNFDLQNLPEGTALLVHLLLVAVLGFVLPISKLLHIPGVFYAPTRNQVDNPREKRHIADWAKPLDETRENYPELVAARQPKTEEAK